MANAKKASTAKSAVANVVENGKLITSGLMTSADVMNIIKSERAKKREEAKSERTKKRESKPKAVTEESKKEEPVSNVETILHVANTIKTADEYRQIIECFKEAMAIAKTRIEKASEAAEKTKSEEKTEKPKKSEKKTEKKADKTENKFGEVFQGVKQVMSVTAKVRKDLGLTLTRYTKKDGTVSKIYILSGTADKATKALHDLMESKFDKIASYKGWADGYVINEKNIKEFSKAIGIKIA